MQPTSASFLLVAGVLTAAAVIGSIVLSPRLSGGIWRLLARTLLQLVAHVLVVIMVAAVINRAMGFFPTWASLISDGKFNGAEQTMGKPADALKKEVSATGLGKAPSQLPVLPTPGSRVQEYEVTGPNSHFATKIMVLLPKEYDPKRSEEYPVMVALHGYPATPDHWTKHMQIQTKLDEAVASKKIAPTLVVMPQVNMPQAVDTECVDGTEPGHPKVETFLAKDLPGWVTSHFRAKTERAAWNTIGYSAGGYCSLMVAMKHPEAYGTAISFSGYLTPAFSSAYQPFPENSSQAKSYNLIEVARSAPGVALWIQRDDITAGRDSSGKSEVKRLIEAAKAPLSITTFDQPGAGHLTVVWKEGLVRSFTWLGRASPSFAPR
ncbi:alpha/beta hydrolase [Austwickia chelonae]|uniref:alpha/beta hydrolase n=1 Tax=Austwickia chelonae TaxID=100225 RepID=UPI000E27B76D|nr:alpha/beta hydrolase-fold protein [Austwickia chelonae]